MRLPEPALVVCRQCGSRQQHCLVYMMHEHIGMLRSRRMYWLYDAYKWEIAGLLSSVRLQATGQQCMTAQSVQRRAQYWQQRVGVAIKQTVVCCCWLDLLSNQCRMLCLKHRMHASVQYVLDLYVSTTAVRWSRSKRPDKLWSYHMSIRVGGKPTKPAISRTTCPRLLGARARVKARTPWATYCMCATLPVSMILMKTLMMIWTSECKYAITQTCTSAQTK